MQAVELARSTLAFACRLPEALARDLTDDELWQRPPGDNPALWVLGHLAVNRCALFRILTGEDRVPAGWRELFGTGSAPPTDLREDYPSSREVWRTLGELAKAIDEHLATLTDVDLDRPITTQDAPRRLGEVLGAFACHQAFHAGQLAPLRTLAGRPAVV